MVPSVGVRRNAVGQAGGVRQVVPQQLRQRVQDADARRARRAGFPRPVHAGTPALYGAPNAEGAVEAAALSRRRPLGPEAAEQLALV